MNLSIIRGVVLVGTVFLSACEHIASREADATAPDAAVTCECPPAPLFSEMCPAILEPEVVPLPEPEPAPAVTEPEVSADSKPCVMPAPAPAKKEAAAQGLLIVGRVENVHLKLNGASKKSLKLKARIDTGAGLSSMGARELVEFERDGAPWVRFSLLDPKTKEPVEFEQPIKRFTSIKQIDNNPQKRPVISVSLKLGDIEENVDVTLTDRSGYVYPVLIGRNFLRDRVVVDVSRKFVASDGEHLN